MINVRDSVNDGGCMGCSSRENVKVIMLGSFQVRICSNCLLDIIEQAHLTKRAVDLRQKARSKNVVVRGANH
jgi:hypothetical protein